MRLWVAALALALLAGCGDAGWGPDRHGQVIDAEQSRGKWVLVNYWAEWCAPCRREIPELNALAASAEVLVLGVNYDGLSGPALNETADKLDIRFPVLATDPGPRLGVARPKGLPASLLIDPEGRVREQLLGEQSAAGVLSRIAELARH